MPTEPTPTLLAPEDIASRLGKSAEYWLRKARRREVPHVRIGQSIRFTEDDAVAIVRAMHVDAVDPLRSVSTRSARRRAS